MMKRLTAICLALLLLLTATAYAAGWEDGYSPNKPNGQVPEIDFSDNIGYMMFAPNAKQQAKHPVHACKALCIYLPREDIMLNNNGGNVVVRSADRGEELRIPINDPNYVTLRPMTESELADHMWGGGTCIEIRLPVSLRLGCTYYVDVDAGCFYGEEGGIGNPAINGADSWHFEMLAEYGVSELEYLRTNSNGAEESVLGLALAGDTVRFDLVLGGDAKSATLYKMGNAGEPEKIVFPVALLTESCEITGEVTGDDPIWGVLFWDTEVPPTDPDDAVNHLVGNVVF